MSSSQRRTTSSRSCAPSSASTARSPRCSSPARWPATLQPKYPSPNLHSKLDSYPQPLPGARADAATRGVRYARRPPLPQAALTARVLAGGRLMDPPSAASPACQIRRGSFGAASRFARGGGGRKSGLSRLGCFQIDPSNRPCATPPPSLTTESPTAYGLRLPYDTLYCPTPWPCRSICATDAAQFYHDLRPHGMSIGPSAGPALRVRALGPCRLAARAGGASVRAYAQPASRPAPAWYWKKSAYGT